MGTDPNSPDNRWLRDAMQQQIPVIYFLGASPGRYQPIIPTFIVGWHPERFRVQIAFGALGRVPRLKPRSQALQSAATPCERSIIQRCRLERLQRPLCDLPFAQPRLLDTAYIVMIRTSS
jgi:putative restriction endonuclease